MSIYGLCMLWTYLSICLPRYLAASKHWKRAHFLTVETWDLPPEGHKNHSCMHGLRLSTADKHGEVKMFAIFKSSVTFDSTRNACGHIYWTALDLHPWNLIFRHHVINALHERVYWNLEMPQLLRLQFSVNVRETAFTHLMHWTAVHIPIS